MDGLLPEAAVAAAVAAAAAQVAAAQAAVDALAMVLVFQVVLTGLHHIMLPRKLLMFQTAEQETVQIFNNGHG